MRTFILPYKRGRAVPRKLSEMLGWRRLKLEGSKYRPKRGDVIVNWGFSREHNFSFNYPIINDIDNVALAVNKFDCLAELENQVSIVRWTSNSHDAEQWINEGATVYCRTLLNGHSGQGIVIATTKEELVPAPLYTKGIGKCREYRIHVIDGECVLVAQKKRRNGGDANGLVKNFHTGWVYATNDIYPLSDAAIQDGRKAIKVLGLDFGAVDIATRDGSHFILEVNTAPGLKGKTLEIYANKLAALVEKRRS